ncbi:catechol 2,3-dioxygenase-like lactoylglutathione lyase family enzyme [Caldalkalibacillus uzonensis]|uniref:Catechol 2,3-dioxygenase-like lactoylglutathione lyase family enzyme n=1 Tax=Caldalkalibacillus uzonensis TaxID=353224 RepID=A0ABU0CM47_9BACI|nr:VOC family protein [Caldalkalibacillus uzonensis]MDQ0337495.1 catechol 2,3-dioxygenase-like lactoylglutathione lyase family enzyme [Caldalkalibacillus uzonensis]
MPATQGIHHVTAIAGDVHKNVAFYRDILGLRLVKQTVNFDMPDTYHLYFGDRIGSPGTILTFFPWPMSPKGRKGNRAGSHHLSFCFCGKPVFLAGATAVTRHPG